MVGWFCCVRCRVHWHTSWHKHRCQRVAVVIAIRERARFDAVKKMARSFKLALNYERQGLVVAAERWLGNALYWEQEARLA